MNLLSKKTPWIAASLIATASVFGQTRNQQQQQQQQRSFNQGYEVGNMQMMSGYNAPARIDVRGAWDFYAVGSFIFWQPIQDNMELGLVSNQTAPAAFDIVDVQGNIVNMDFSFKPGFKVGLGMNFDMDQWDSFVQYTWFRGTHSVSSSQDAAQSPIVDVIWPMRGDTNLSLFTNGFSSASEKWTLNMDLLDWELGRSEYVGKNLTFRPFVGARAAWIRQKNVVNYTNNFNSANVAVDTVERSNSWAVGPRLGLYSNWILGQGFRLYGNGGGDILFTRYTKLSEETTLVDADAVLDNSFSHSTQRDLNALRTHLDLELGFGWGTYFDNNNWHVDLTAGYTFQVFFKQNMFRTFQGVLNNKAHSNVALGDLYINGLTTNLRFDF